MQRIPRPLFILHPSPVLRARVQQAAGREFSPEIVPGWRSLNEKLTRASLTALAIVDPYLEGNGGLAPALQILSREFPSVALVAALEVNSRRPADLHTLGLWRVEEIILMEEHDAVAIGRLLRSMWGIPLQSLLERSLPAKLSVRARSILHAAAEVAAEGGQSDDLARALHASMRNLLRWCEREDLPPPRQVLAWMRILLAAEMLEDPGRSVEGIARACGYASDSGLRRAFSDFLGENPRGLRKQGAFATASRAFQTALTGSRGAKPKREEPIGRSMH